MLELENLDLQHVSWSNGLFLDQLKIKGIVHANDSLGVWQDLLNEFVSEDSDNSRALLPLQVHVGSIEVLGHADPWIKEINVKSKFDGGPSAVAVSNLHIDVASAWLPEGATFTAPRLSMDSLGNWGGEGALELEALLRTNFTGSGQLDSMDAQISYESVGSAWPDWALIEELEPYLGLWDGLSGGIHWQKNGAGHAAIVEVNQSELGVMLKLKSDSLKTFSTAVSAKIKPTLYNKEWAASLEPILEYIEPQSIDAEFVTDFTNWSDISVELRDSKTQLHLTARSLEEPAQAKLNTESAGLAPVDRIELSTTLYPGLKQAAQGKDFRLVGVFPKVSVHRETIKGLSFDWYHGKSDSVYLACLDTLFDLEAAVEWGADSIQLSSDIHRLYLGLLDPVDTAQYLTTRVSARSNYAGFGTASLTDLLLERPTDVIFMEKFTLWHQKNRTKKLLKFESDVLQGSLDGEWSWEHLPRIGEKIFSDIKGDPLNRMKWPNGDFKVSLAVANADWLTDLLHLNAHIEEGSFFEARYKSERELWLFNTQSQHIQYEETNLYDLNANLVQSSFAQSGRITADSVVLGSDRLDSIHLRVNGLDTGRTFVAHATFQDSIPYILDFSGRYSWGKLLLKTLQTNVGTSTFEMSMPNLTRWNEAGIYLEGLSLSGPDGVLGVYGALPLVSTGAGTIYLSIRGLDSEILNYLLRSPDLQFGGNLDGQLQWSGGTLDPTIWGTIRYNNLSLQNKEIGDLTLEIKQNPNIPSWPVEGALRKEGKVVTHLRADIFPETKKFLTTGKLTGLDLAPFNPFLSGVLDHLQGQLYGNFSAAGSFEDWTVNSNLQLRGTGFSVPIIGPFLESTSPIALKVTDRSIEIVEPAEFMNPKDGTRATLWGNIWHDHFNHLNFDLSLHTDSLRAVDVANHAEAYFYGVAVASGDMTLKGPLEQLALKMEVGTKEGTHFKIPLDNPTIVEQASFLRFVGDGYFHESDSSEPASMPAEYFTTDIAMHVTPEATVDLVLDEVLGDVISANGSGNLRMKILEDETFELYGLYNVESGSYLFTLQNLVNKPFTLMPGGSILWSGDLYGAVIDLEAKYQLRTDLDGLVTNPNYNGSQVDVDLIIELTGGLMQPEVAFRIELPGSPSSYVEELNRHFLSTDQINYQAFSLLMLGDFYKSDLGIQEGIDITGSVTNTTNEVLMSQFGQWITAGIGDYVELELDYTQGNNPYNTLGVANGDELNLGVSKAFLDGRLRLNSSFDVPIGQSGTSTLLLGDTEVQYDLSKDGRIVLKAFNKSNRDNPLLYNTGAYMQGVGIQYQKEFERTGLLKTDSTARSNK